MSDEFDYRSLQAADLEQVIAIERASYPHPWNLDRFTQEMNNPLARVLLICRLEQVCGYLCYWLIAGEMEIHNLATAPAWRRQGIAGRLLDKAFTVAQGDGLEVVWLEVRETNRAAINLYQANGFTVQDIRKKYYRDGENALVMARRFVCS